MFSSSHYAEYLREKTGDQIIETLEGFVTYRYLNDSHTVYVVDIYIVPEMRKSGYASRLVDLVVQEAKAKGAIELLGTVHPSSKGSTASMLAQLKYGFQLHSVSHDAVILRKDI